jgi:hypothetical protein
MILVSSRMPVDRHSVAFPKCKLMAKLIKRVKLLIIQTIFVNGGLRSQMKIIVKTDNSPRWAGKNYTVESASLMWLSFVPVLLCGALPLR